MQKNYAIQYKLNEQEMSESVINSESDAHPISELTAYQIVVLKHSGLQKGEPSKKDVYTEAQELGITDLKVQEA
jgi:tRNA A37 threonylcarbamoyladenosine modification protein TsaB